jgi:BCD family chlorophyll transporter-like MFS transporter
MRTVPAAWNRIAQRFLPFADAATAKLPLGRLLRLSLFQVSCGMTAVLLTGTLNRVMIVELKLAAAMVAAMVALPLFFAPARALIGFKSDTHRSVLGWRRIPYIWFGTLMQFGGFAFLPFALIIMSGDTTGPVVIGEIAAAAAFLLVGAGLHTTQTAGLALATDLASETSRPRVVALLYVMLLVGTLVSAIVIGTLLADFSQFRLIQVIQGVAAAIMLLNGLALWKQEARNPQATRPDRTTPAFSSSWQTLLARGQALRLLVTVGLGAAAFAMQDVLLEPYGGEVLGLGVGATTLLTALWSAGALAGFAAAAHLLGRGTDPHRLAGLGGVAGIAAFATLVVAGALGSPLALRLAVAGIGFGSGLFAVGTLTAVMALARDDDAGLVLGAWGAVQATSAGLAIALSGVIRDAFAGYSGYATVYVVEIILLFATLAAIGPLVGRANAKHVRFGLAEFPA